MAAAMDCFESPFDQPFMYLRHDTVETIAVNITMQTASGKMDWRSLAGVLGFSSRQVQLMQQHPQDHCKGRLLINTWERILGESQATLRKLIYALKEANMGESLKIIREDEDLKGEDFNGVLKEYEQLKAEGKLRKIFPRIPMDKFIEVLYPSVRMDDLLSFSSFSRSVEVETNIQSRVDHQYEVLEDRSVYISFCPEGGLTNRKFNNELRRFAELIQNQGFTLHFEPNCQLQIRKYGGLLTWKEACIKKSKNIIVICTPEYYKEDSKAIDCARRGSKIELDSRLLRQIAYSSDNSRIIPVFLDARRPSVNQIPMWLQPLLTHSWPSGENNLLLCLEGKPRYILPKVDPSKRKVIKPIVIGFPDVRGRKV